METSRKMELRFLGQSYSSNSIVVETINSGIIARFRGQSYIPKRSIYSSKSQLTIRKYRGVLYCKIL